MIWYITCIFVWKMLLVGSPKTSYWIGLFAKATVLTQFAATWNIGWVGGYHSISLSILSPLSFQWYCSYKFLGYFQKKTGQFLGYLLELPPQTQDAGESHHQDDMNHFWAVGISTTQPFICDDCIVGWGVDRRYPPTWRIIPVDVSG